MPRSSLLNALLNIAAEIDRAHRAARPPSSGPRIARRAVLHGAASIAGATLLPRLPALAAAEARVAVVGAGLAGLTAAHELSKAGLKSIVERPCGVITKVFWNRRGMCGLGPKEH